MTDTSLQTPSTPLRAPPPPQPVTAESTTNAPSPAKFDLFGALATSPSKAKPAEGRIRNLAQLRSRLAAFSDVASRLEKQKDTLERRGDDEYRQHISPTKKQSTSVVRPPESSDSDEE